MLTLHDLRTSKRNAILSLAARHGAHDLRVFGSIARGEQRGDNDASSDLDLLVSWDRGRDLFDHVELKEDLQDLLGVKVDVITEKTLHWYIRDRVIAAARPL